MNEIAPAVTAPTPVNGTQLQIRIATVAQNTPDRLPKTDFIAPSSFPPPTKKLEQPAKPIQAGMPMSVLISIQAPANKPAAMDIDMI